MRRGKTFKVLVVLASLLVVAAVTGRVFMGARGHVEPFPETQPSVRYISSVESRIARAVVISEQLTLTTIGEVVYGEYRAPVW